jgi:hypothetical protein
MAPPLLHAVGPTAPRSRADGDATHWDPERKMRDAIALHFDGLPETSQPMPEPSELATAYVKVTG